jgi:hypothetical protein
LAYLLGRLQRKPPVRKYKFHPKAAAGIPIGGRRNVCATLEEKALPTYNLRAGGDLFSLRAPALQIICSRLQIAVSHVQSAAGYIDVKGYFGRRNVPSSSSRDTQQSCTCATRSLSQYLRPTRSSAAVCCSTLLITTSAHPSRSLAAGAAQKCSALKLLTNCLSSHLELFHRIAGDRQKFQTICRLNSFVVQKRMPTIKT